MRSARVAIAVLLLAAGCGGAKHAVTAETQGESASSAACEVVDDPPARGPAILEVPRRLLDPSRTYTLAFDTTCGTFVVRLDQKLAPHTTASLVSLARKHYFDDTPFIRIVPDFVIQGGDPTQTGAGQPGYSTIDVPPRGTRYTRGTVAMAKAETDAPGTAGSQFFVVTGKDVKLQPIYAVVGRVTSGLDVVGRIGGLGTKTEAPARPIVIRTVTVHVGS
jgi:cyclophilin family peptidyl-prolyl cis-trans isomerase